MNNTQEGYIPGKTIYQRVGEGMQIKKNGQTLEIIINRIGDSTIEVLVSGAAGRDPYTPIQLSRRRMPELDLGRNIKVTVKYEAISAIRAPMVYRAPEGYQFTPINTDI